MSSTNNNRDTKRLKPRNKPYQRKAPNNRFEDVDDLEEELLDDDDDEYLDDIINKK